MNTRRTLVAIGFTSPIVEALIDQLPPETWRILGVYRNRSDRAELLAQKARSRNIDVRCVRCDVSHAEDVENLIAGVPDGSVDLLYAAAAPLRLQAVVRSDPEEFRTQFDTNVIGALLVTRGLAAKWRRAGDGHAVFVLSSVTLGELSDGLAAYAAAKHALLAFAQVLSNEERRYGLSVSAVSPTAFKSALWRDVPELAHPSATDHRPSSFDRILRNAAKSIVTLLSAVPDMNGTGTAFQNTLIDEDR